MPQLSLDEFLRFAVHDSDPPLTLAARAVAIFGDDPSVRAAALEASAHYWDWCVECADDCVPGADPSKWRLWAQIAWEALRRVRLGLTPTPSGHKVPA